MTTKDVEVRVAEMLTLRCVLPRLWKPRLWLAAQVFWFGALISGMSCIIEIDDKK